MYYNAESGDAIASKEQAGENKEEKKSGDPRQPKATKSHKTDECSGCGKAFKKVLWYYKNGAFFCNKRCSKNKREKSKEKTSKA
ncbi:hypothetical protein OMAG_002148 [Candidatus Omnitrophus magneticus]|uniref:Uncharacterized protein n=1 Tax=Candidatus Omnitrophus magneticus TaxID=1609969 RepID=A0A0F0CR28_9BACT|nr:hypothetical protein OMAG_002148 [Candidatus Omnitrophus magneticus]